MKGNRIFIRGHHLSTLANHYLEGECSIAPFLYPDTMSIHRTFNENPSLLVEIVEGMDSICEAQGAEECPDFNNTCTFPDIFWDEDRETLREYGVNVGETYLASDLLERFIDYYNSTGHKSPRAKFFKKEKQGANKK